MKKSLLLVFFMFALIGYSQEYFPTNSGVKTPKNKIVAFTNATIYVSPTNIQKNATLVIQHGKVLHVGNSVTIPKGAEIINLKGKFIYPSFIDIYSNFGIEKPKRVSMNFNKPQYEASRKGYYWNDHIKPDTNPVTKFKFETKKANELLKAGFGVVNTHLQDGIVRGPGMLVALNTTAANGTRILSSKSAQYLSFTRSNTTKQVYPNSLMGAMVLLRQLYIDANWYDNGNSNNTDAALEAFNKNKGLVQIFEAGSKLNDLRADKVGDENGIQYVIVGGGDEYENVAQMKATNATFVLPVNFRKAYDVSNPFLADQVDLSDMRKWNQEPANLKILHNNGVTFALTTHKLKKLSDFNKNLQKAIAYGFEKNAALASLTTIPATILGKQQEIGTLDKGKWANFLITSGELFGAETVLYENWVQGAKNVINDMNIKEIAGKYNLSLNNTNYTLKITGKGEKVKAAVTQGKTKISSKITYKDHWISLILNDTINKELYTRLTTRVQKKTENLKGFGYTIEGNRFTWTAIKDKEVKSAQKVAKKKGDSQPSIVPITFPNVAYGFAKQPEQQTLLFKNATVWTNENEGILTNTDVLIKNGIIDKIGTNLKAGKAVVIDATGKHLTAGIIDEHSHIATAAVNEVGHNSTAEVSIEDVVNPDDIKIYRNLAGGVTSIQILHGSANPIGGQSALVKLKWGAGANEMLYKNNDKFIKFALGENVKQSRSSGSTRFPQTRMGVEEVYMDYFQRAKEYDALKKSGKPYRKDIEMEILTQILNKERFITCHSYVQSEINMMMKVAEKFDFTINTFTHILEGYKVADKMKKHGAGASTFSDWWAYKYEVNDAIPYNAAIMHEQGVTVAINSDNAEMGRRLNQEAAKTVKYGDVSEEEAWKFVTLNPAKLLHIDHRVGSIKVGKDADVVLWSENPLSVYAKAEKTLIEGAVYFDMEKDLKMQQAVKKERNKLINLMLKEKNKGGNTQAPVKKDPTDFHCDTVVQF